MVDKQENKFPFDKAVSISGQVITIFAVLVFGLSGWYEQRKSVSVLEDARIMQRQLHQARVAVVDAHLQRHDLDMRDLRIRMDKLSDIRKGK